MEWHAVLGSPVVLLKPPRKQLVNSWSSNRSISICDAWTQFIVITHIYNHLQGLNLRSGVQSVRMHSKYMYCSQCRGKEQQCCVAIPGAFVAINCVHKLGQFVWVDALHKCSTHNYSVTSSPQLCQCVNRHWMDCTIATWHCFCCIMQDGRHVFKLAWGWMQTVRTQCIQATV